jgi:ketosteroid isomerase-like protein
MMDTNAQRGSVFGAEDQGTRAKSRFDLANLHIQRYGEAAIASYTLLISTALPQGVKVAAHNESRVMVKIEGKWKVVHVHKSPAWGAPHVQP